MNKNKMVTSVSAFLLLTTSAFAGTVSDIADCNLANPVADNNVSVTLVQTFSSRVGQPNKAIITATVTRDTFVGAEVIGVYTVKFKAPAKGIVGSRGQYVGQGFELSLPLTAPRTDTLRSAGLTAVANQQIETNQKIDENLLCKFYQ